MQPERQLWERPQQKRPVFEPAQDAEVLEDLLFSYRGYQVVRSEFFSHTHEPSISFNNGRIQFNAACLRKMPTVNYVQFLVNPESKSLAVRPCHEDDKDAFAWCSIKNEKRTPRPITGKLFMAKIMAMMDWNPNHRYKLLGKIIRREDEYLLLFDMNATEVYMRISKADEKPKLSRTPVFPADWKDQFGLPVEEHQKSLQINIFEGYTVFRVPDTAKDEQAVTN